MSELVPVFMDENNQRPISSVWRNTFIKIVESFKDGDFKLERRIEGVSPISLERYSRIASNIRDYGARLTNLPDDAWKTSVCQWMRGYWDVLIDLFTIEEGASDLALAVRVYEENSSYIFEIQSVYVP